MMWNIKSNWQEELPDNKKVEISDNMIKLIQDC